MPAWPLTTRTTLAALRRGYHRHFILHGYDLGPIGFLLVACQRWGIDAADVVPALQGASPATSEPARVLARLRAEVAASGTTPATLDEVRALSPEASAEVDQYLRYRGMQVFSRYDLDGVTLGELPEVVLATILDGREAQGTHDPEACAAALRERVPAAERATFDDLLTEARFAMNLRDDNGPTTAEWRLGLLRRAMLETGDRLAATRTHRRGRPRDGDGARTRLPRCSAARRRRRPTSWRHAPLAAPTSARSRHRPPWAVPSPSRRCRPCRRPRPSCC